MSCPYCLSSECNVRRLMMVQSGFRVMELWECGWTYQKALNGFCLFWCPFRDLKYNLQHVIEGEEEFLYRVETIGSLSFASLKTPPALRHFLKERRYFSKERSSLSALLYHAQETETHISKCLQLQTFL